MRISGPKTTLARAAELRRNMTKPERLLWWAIRRKAIGHRFRRQHPAGPYVLDFYCDALRLAVEVDGESHDSRAAQDRRRDAWLHQLGIYTLRISARDTLENLEGAVQLVAQEAQRRSIDLERSPPPALRATSPCRGRS